MTARLWLGGSLAMLVWLAVGAAPSGTRTVVVHAERRGYGETPVTVAVTPPNATTGVSVTEAGRELPCQVRRIGNRLAVTWLVTGLRQGQKRTYALKFERSTLPGTRHQVRRVGNDVDLLLDGALFARYDVTTGPNKPFFHPVYAPGQKMVVRGFPVSPKPGETNDHPHHQGMWFTHGSVNGEDFWSLSQARTQHAGFGELYQGPVFCGFTSATNWIARNGETIARDSREFRAYVLGGHRVMDVAITVRPVGKAIVFGDTKEGSFGLRLADSMRVRGGDGRIVNSEGQRDTAAWGKRAAWVDYYGTVEGETIGVAIFDHPKSFRHPTYWHVRDYGLFAVNPFGIHDFDRGQPADAGNHTVSPGESLRLMYRLIFHRGSTEEARIADLWAQYTEPPVVVVR